MKKTEQVSAHNQENGKAILFAVVFFTVIAAVTYMVWAG
jgi:hypothetical protein